MAITIASANTALERNGLQAYELVKHVDGTLKIEFDSIGEVVPMEYIDTGATRVRDLSVTQVVSLALKHAEAREHAKMLNRCVNAGKSAIPLISKGVGFISATKVFGDRIANHIQTSGDADFLTSNDRRFTIVDEANHPVKTGDAQRWMENAARSREVLEQLYPDKIETPLRVCVKADSFVAQVVEARERGNVGKLDMNQTFGKLGSHVHRRAQESFGDARRALPKLAVRHHGMSAPGPAHGWDIPTTSAVRSLANKANDDFITRHLSNLPNDVGVFVQRSGSLLCRSGESGASVRLQDLVGSRFMRDRSPSWWCFNIPNIAEGRPVVEKEPELSPARVRDLAGQIMAYKIANRTKVTGNGYGYAVLHFSGLVSLHYKATLREAFQLINIGERVFIPSAELGRYDREVRDGKHGEPRGLNTL